MIPAGHPPEPDSPAASLARRAREVEAWLVQELARVVEAKSAEIDVDRPLPSFGLSSRQEFTVATALEEWLGYELPPTVIWDYPTIRDLSWYVARTEAGQDGTGY